MLETPTVSHLSQVISQSIAPAFILGAVASFISVLVTRLNRVIDRCRILGSGNESQEPRDAGEPALSRLNARANLINRAIYCAVGSAFATLLLMIVAFVAAFLDFPHERGVGFLFIVALILFCASLVYFGREIRIVMKDPDNFD
jgi:Protein of unknown function (DUF2721)